MDGKEKLTLPETERSVLGTLIRFSEDDGLFPYAEVHGGEDLFFNPEHKIIYRAIKSCHETHNKSSLPMVIAAVKETNRVSDLVVYVSGLYEVTFSAVFFESEVDDLQKVFLARVTSDTMKRTLHEVSVSSTEDKIAHIEECKKFLDTALSSQSPYAFVEAGNVAASEYQRYERIFTGKEQLSRIPTTFMNIDTIIGGLLNESFNVWAGRPGCGKSAITHNVAIRLGMRGIPTAIFSLEMSKEELAKRMLCTLANVNMQSAENGIINNLEMKSLETAAHELALLPITIDDSTSLTVNDIDYRIRRLKKTKNVQAVFIDYLQLINPDKASARHSRELQVAIISRRLKAITKEVPICIIGLSQMNREYEKRTGEAGRTPKPRLSDLRESGQIEQDAHTVSFLYWVEPLDDEDDKEYIDVNFLIAKNRNGRTGNAKLRFWQKYTKFEELPNDTNRSED